MKVVNLHDSPSLLEIPSHLRALADRIESGEQIAESCYCIIIEPDEFKPAFFGWGKVADRYGICGVFTLCASLVLKDKED